MSNLNPGGLTRVLNYLKTWVTGLLNDKANSSHSHDDRYYTESEINTKLNSKSDTSHNHNSAYLGISAKAESAKVADYAKLLAYSHTNEINFKGGRQATCYFNYRNADDDSTDTAATVEYKFCNYGGNSVSNVTVSAGTFKENGSSLADKYQAKGSYASSSHTHTKSQITDFPTIPTKTSQLTNDSGYITSSGSCNYATNSGYTNWLRTSSHADHLFHTEWDGSYFWTYVTTGDGGYRAVRVERSNSSGWADSAGGVAWGNVSSRPTAVSQFTNDIGFITSSSLMYINGDRAHNAYRIVYGSFNNLNNISTGRCWVSFPSAFSSAPTVVITISNPDGLYNYQISNITTTGFIAEIWDESGNRTGNGVAGTYIAIGNS